MFYHTSNFHPVRNHHWIKDSLNHTTWLTSKRNTSVGISTFAPHSCLLSTATAWLASKLSAPPETPWALSALSDGFAVEGSEGVISEKVNRGCLSLPSWLLLSSSSSLKSYTTQRYITNCKAYQSHKKNLTKSSSEAYKEIVYLSSILLKYHTFSASTTTNTNYGLTQFHFWSQSVCYPDRVRFESSLKWSWLVQLNLVLNREALTNKDGNTA